MLVTESSRPRDLTWKHSGPLLYGDWGTSRLYVLGLAFFFTAHASVAYLAAIGLLMIAVSWAYTVVCRCFPDGGGVYTAARQLHPVLSVVGATLLLCGYIITASISAVEAFHYFGLPHEWTLPLSAITIGLIGIINYFGARSAGKFAFLIATIALLVSLVMAIGAVFLTPFFMQGLRTVNLHGLADDPWRSWVNFTKICLALAGVEAVANMTGLMKKPVVRTANLTIWPVAVEVVGLNVVFGLALAGLAFVVGGVPMAEMHTADQLRLEERLVEFGELAPEHADAAHEGFTLTDEQIAALSPDAADAYADFDEHRAQTELYTNAAMKVVAQEIGREVFGTDRAAFICGKVAGVTFGLLLLSATNTVVMAMVSVLYSMAQDRELPRVLTKLNYSGVPWVGLIAAVVMPVLVLVFERDVVRLAELYVIGVCGAITTNILSCAINRHLDIHKGERWGMWVLGAFLLAITLTIAVTKLNATLFAGGVVGLALATRGAMRIFARPAPEPLETPAMGWLAEVRRQEPVIDPSSPKIMLAARGRYQSEFAVDLAKRRKATLFTVFVRTLRLMDLTPGQLPRVEEDPDAQQALGTTAVLARQAGVPFIPIYIVSPGVAEEIVDHTVTYGCDTLILGKSRRSPFSRKLEGDVISQVARLLPDEVALITRAGDKPHVPRAGASE